MRTPAALLLTCAALAASAASASAAVTLVGDPSVPTVDTGQPIRLFVLNNGPAGQPSPLSDPSSPQYEPSYVDPFRTPYLDPFAAVGTYDWDMNGDGVYETSTGGANSLDYRFTVPYFPGGVDIGARVTRPDGSVETSTRHMWVCRAASAGPPSVTLNGGAKYTNRAAVTVTVAWPRCAGQMTLANDAGFAAPTTTDVAPTVPWKLATTGAEHTPKTVYLRFDQGPATLSASIVLDRTPPVVSAAKLTVKGTKKKTYRVVVKAKDATSGLAAVQVAAGKRKPSKAVPYAASVTVRGGAAPRFVRVTDRAGNVGPWRAITQPKAQARRGK